MQSRDVPLSSEEAVSRSVDNAALLATFDQHRGLLFSVAYRMLGSVADAEDMLQETFICWQGASDEEIRNPRAYLVTIISRLCINHMQSARVQRASRADRDWNWKRSSCSGSHRRVDLHGIPGAFGKAESYRTRCIPPPRSLRV